MARKSQKTLRLKMTIPSKVTGEPLIHMLSHDLHVAPNIVRGRIGPSSAWLEIEIAGSQKNLDRALSFLKEKGVIIEDLD